MRATSGAVIFSDALLLVVLWRQGSIMPIMKSTKVLNPRRCIMRVYTREIRMRVHENTHGKMADCTHGRTTEGVLDLCNGAVSEKTPQIF